MGAHLNIQSDSIAIKPPQFLQNIYNWPFLKGTISGMKREEIEYSQYYVFRIVPSLILGWLSFMLYHLPIHVDESCLDG